MSTASSQPNLPSNQPGTGHPAAFWLAVILVGLGAGLAGGVLMQLLHAVEHLAWGYDCGDLLKGAERASGARHVAMLLVAAIVVGPGGWLLGRTLGQGADVNAAIWRHSGDVPILATLGRAVQSIVAVGFGTSLGREAPIKQAGGTIASGVARWCKFSPERRRVLVACGVGAGMAAAYNVPLGGALFAVEVLLGVTTLELVLPALAASAIATLASWTLLPAEPIYDVPEFPLSASLVVWSILTGPLYGLAAVVLIRLIGWTGRRKKPTGWRGLTAPFAVLGLLGLASIPFPELLGNGKDSVQLAFSDQVSTAQLWLLPGLKLTAIIACLACGARGGLFTPTMMIGALAGSLLGHCWEHVMPGASLGCSAVVGACALLAASSQGPTSAVVMTLELTRHVDPTMVPILLAVSGAMLTVRRIEPHSVYSIRVD